MTRLITQFFHLFIVVALFLSPTLYAGQTSSIKNLDTFLFPLKQTEDAPQTETIVVYKNGSQIFEKSRPGFHSDKPFILWSVTKSVSSLILGAAVENQFLKIHESVCEIAPQFKEKLDCRMTLAHILDWSSGLNFLEVYEGNADRTQSSVGQMLYGDGYKDNVAFILSHKQIYEPGKHFYYSSGDSGLLLGLLKSRMSEDQYRSFPQKSLFTPLGIQSAIFETDLTGHLMSGTSLYMSSQDLIKIGQLVLNQGLHNGQRLIPKDWISYVTAALPHFKESKSDPLWIPGRQWWRPNFQKMGLENFSTMDVFVGRGHWGQYLVIIPSMKLVAVRFGLDQKKPLDEAQLIKLLLQLGAES